MKKKHLDDVTESLKGTKRDFDARLKYLRNPPRMSFAQALASPNPTSEIGLRIEGPYESLTPAERTYWEASYFLGDTLNGGLMQTLENSTADHAGSVEAFVRSYCDDRLVVVFAELNALFPSGRIPSTREERQEAIEKMMRSEDDDPFEELTRRFYALEKEFDDGLLTFAIKHQDQFRGFRA